MGANIFEVTSSLSVCMEQSSDLLVNRFYESIKGSVGNVVAIYVSVYRLSGVEYVCCDIESADAELLPITIAITGNTLIDEVITSSGIELRDHTDAFLFLRGLM